MCLDHNLRTNSSFGIVIVLNSIQVRHVMSLILKRVLTRKDCLTKNVTKGIQGAFGLPFADLGIFFFENRIKDYKTDFK